MGSWFKKRDMISGLMSLEPGEQDQTPYLILQSVDKNILTRVGSNEFSQK